LGCSLKGYGDGVLHWGVVTNYTQRRMGVVAPLIPPV
jgi:hypothetical protein